MTKFSVFKAIVYFLKANAQVNKSYTTVLLLRDLRPDSV